MGQVDDPALREEILPFSLSQQEVWLDQRAWPGSTHLNIGGAGYIDGSFDLTLFRRALAYMVAESEALRLVPLAEGGQRLLATYEAPLKLVDVSTADDPLSAMRSWWQNWIVEPFAFDGTPPWRFALLRYSDRLHGLTIQFHHLIMDGWGTSQVMQRWAAIYNALMRGEEPLPTSDPGYRQFVAESLEYRNSAAFTKDAAFWQEQVPVLPPPLFDRRYRLDLQGGLPAAHLHTESLRRADYDRQAAVATGLGSTHFAYLIAVIAAYFAQAYGRQEVLIGLPSLNRSSKRYRETQGMFVGVFPLLVRVLPSMTFRELLDTVGLSLKAAIRHQRYPISEVARYLGAIRHRRDSIFDVLFSFERQDYDLNFGEGRSFGSRQIFSGIARYPLGVTLCEFQSNQDAELTLEASPACFSAAELAYLGKRLTYLMLDMAEAPGQQIDRFQLVSPDDLQALVPESPFSSAERVAAEPYIRQFKRQAEKTPHAVAVLWDGGQLDYAALDAWSDCLAARLGKLGAGRDTVVALAMERSAELLAAMLAVNKAGAAFLPLDPDAPLPRLQAIIEDSGALALLVQSGKRGERFAALHASVVGISPIPECGASLSGGLAIAPSDLAYVLFTSGSTGRPKGVMVEHGALALRLAWISRAWEVQPKDRTGQCTQATFDPSLIELFVPLINGASIALPPPGRLLPSALGPFAVRNGVTIMALVPSTVRGLLDSLNDRSSLKLRVACCGGEVLPAELANRYLDETGARLFNVYGPTETAIFASAWECVRQPVESSLPVGRAIDGSRIYVLDAGHRIMPCGTAGEVYIAGQTVARGYLNRRDLNSEAFFEDPFYPGERMYRTGDRGWLATDGNLHFIGRVDRQIKLRGYRIELGEIEATLLTLDGVQQAAAKLLEWHGKPAIHAWVAGLPLLPVERIRQHLASRLPDYMLPAGISCLPELPISAIGKIAYELLPEPADQAEERIPRAPANAMERALLALWQAVLKRDGLGVNDNFFDAGGDSLAAVDILAGMETLVGRTVPLFTLTEHPTIEQLARILGEGEVSSSNGIMLHLTPRGGKIPLYFAASGHGDLIRFRNLADVLGDDFDFFMLQPPANELITSTEQLATAYAEQILNTGRPGILAGFSVGGVAALEAARHLQRVGFPVYQLCLVDVVFPGRILRSAVLWRLLGWLSRRLNAQELSLNGRHLGGLFKDTGLVAQINAMTHFRPANYGGRVTLIQSSGLQRWQRWLFAPWRKLFTVAPELEIVPGLHGSIFETENVAALAKALAVQTQQMPACDLQ